MACPISKPRWIFAFSVSMAGGLLCGCAQSTQAPAPTAGGQLQRDGGDHFRRGDYVAAVKDWKRAAADAATDAAKADALTNLGTAYQMLGQYELAKQSLDQALDIAERLKDRRRIIVALNAQGADCTLKPDVRQPTAVAPSPGAPLAQAATQPAATTAAPGHETHVFTMAAMPAHVHGGGSGRDHDPHALLERALLLSRQETQDAKSLALQASIHDNLGNWFADTRQFDEALAEYGQCMELGKTLKDPALAAKGAANAGTCGLAAGRFYDLQAALAKEGNSKKLRDKAVALRQKATDFRTRAAAEDADAFEQAAALPDSALKAFLFNEIAQTDEQLASAAPGDPALVDRAMVGYRRAAFAAEKCGDTLAFSYAEGHIGHVLELRHQSADAIDFTRRALFAAQTSQSPDSLYRWQWQLGRLLMTDGSRDAAIDAYKQAADTVKLIRNDIALGNGNQRNHASFREDVGDMYFQLADLLLQKAAATPSPREAEQILFDARKSLEALKSAELEDYLHDDCVQLYKSKRGQKADESIVEGTAVMYIIPLEDRIELLVQIGSHLYARTSSTPRKALDDTVREFGRKQRSIGTSEYKISAAQLFKWLIEPIETLLKENKIDTLVFVPDGQLRTVSMAALYDARDNTHLIEHYAIAVVPGLDLLDTGESSPLDNPGAGPNPGSVLLVSGLSQPRGNFRALPFVPIELKEVREAFEAKSSKELLDNDFRVDNLRSEVHNRTYSIVHIASHGHFGADASKTYILTFDENRRLTLDDLEKLIRPQSYSAGGKPQQVDLLVLSCCETAAGDDRAALGLAGVAIKSGARSAIATLWSVNDEASPKLISAFYKHLNLASSSSVGQSTRSKAKALQAAQQLMLRDENPLYHHPVIWAPYLIIGDWQ